MQESTVLFRASGPNSSRSLDAMIQIRASNLKEIPFYKREECYGHYFKNNTSKNVTNVRLSFQAFSFSAFHMNWSPISRLYEARLRGLNVRATLIKRARNGQHRKPIKMMYCKHKFVIKVNLQLAQQFAPGAWKKSNGKRNHMVNFLATE